MRTGGFDASLTMREPRGFLQTLFPRPEYPLIPLATILRTRHAHPGGLEISEQQIPARGRGGGVPCANDVSALANVAASLGLAGPGHGMVRTHART